LEKTKPGLIFIEEFNEMYSNIDEAHAVLEAEFPANTVKTVLAALVPTIGFELADDQKDPPLGATRIGGTPDLPAGTAWPVRPIPANIEAIVDGGGSAHGDHIREHLSRELPFDFTAQIDLAETAKLGKVAKDLPDEGRLLFFCDVTVIPWRSGEESCRVIWDRTPDTSLERKARPRALTELAEKYVAEWNEMARKESYLKEVDVEHTPYWGPARTMHLAARLQLPDRHSVEAQDNAAFVAALTDEEIEEAYCNLFGEYWDKGVTEPIRQHMLGSPIAEQSDPRYQAVLISEYGVQYLDSDAYQAAWPKIKAAAADWQLLFQLDLKDYLQQELTEGTVYFVIRKTDLAARNFDKVVAIYQQT
jgi:uncharacterized protein YwqG